jgi:hypothetical protein
MNTTTATRTRTNPLPRITLDVIRDADGNFVSATIWQGDANRRDYRSEAGMRRALDNLLRKISNAGDAWMTWRGQPMPLSEHPVTRGTAWADWTPADGIVWDRPEDNTWRERVTDADRNR